MPRFMFANPSLPASVLTSKGGWEEAGTCGTWERGQALCSRQCSRSRAERSGVQNRGSSMTIRGSGVPAGRPTGQSSPGLPQEGGLALRRGGSSGDVPPPLGEAQLPQRSGGTFLIIVITAISRSGDNRVLASRLCLPTQPHSFAGAREGPLRAGVLSPNLQMWTLRSSGVQDTHSKGTSWQWRVGLGASFPSANCGSNAWCGHQSSGGGLGIFRVRGIPEVTYGG